LAEFPHVTLWMPTRYEGVAIASLDPLPIDLDRLRQRMAQPALTEDLTAYGLASPEQLLATFVTDAEGLAGYVGDVPLVTDNQPRIEYFSFYPLGRVYLKDLLAHRRPVEDFCTGPLPAPDALTRSRAVMEHLWFAYELERDRRLDAARQRIEQALRIDPKNRYLHYRLAWLNEKTKG
jgi:spermidine synthase